MTGTILVVDDEKNIRRSLRMVLEGEGWTVRDSESAEAALEVLAEEPVDLVVCDVRMGGMSGVDLLQRVRKEPATAALPVIMISGHASVAEAIEAVKLGATDFFEKPLDRERVLVSVRNAMRNGQLQRELETLKARVGAREEMIGDSAAMRRIFTEIEKVAPTRGRVLITGESGTGKELIARAIHRLSPRKDGPFVKVNCAAIPHELVESELFGHEKGAFTGAHGRKRGLFEAAHNGSLFLDEIGDMPLNAQSKLLRALQSGEIVRVGSESVITVDVRVIAATNKQLEREVAEGRFREDLYFRLNVVPLRSPPLRERKEDIPMLVQSFVKDFCNEHGFRLKTIQPEALQALSARTFPGNVRELRNVVERMVILSADTITLDDLPEEVVFGRAVSRREDDDDDGEPMAPVARREEGARMSLREHRDAAERKYITDTLREVDWNISRAAVMLGVERTNLHKKMRALSIRREDDGASS